MVCELKMPKSLPLILLLWRECALTLVWDFVSFSGFSNPSEPKCVEGHWSWTGSHSWLTQFFLLILHPQQPKVINLNSITRTTVVLYYKAN